MKRLSVLLALIIALSAYTAGISMAEDSLGIVNTVYGQVSGIAENGVTYFKGVPYAKPPVGDLRWAAPEEPDAWDGVLVCNEYAPMSMQILSTTDWWGEEFYYDFLDEYPPMSEDCLYLNVVTPATSPDDSYPVFVWFHGGQGMHGYSWEPEFEPSELVKKGVIVVSVGYRLGLFGGLATSALSEASPTGTSGSYGLLDQIESLKWVQKNIAAFGGDPDRVTLGGQSAGAGSVMDIMRSPLSDGLYHRGYLSFRTSFFSGGTTLEAGEERGEAYLAEKGYADLSVEELRALPTSAFMNEETTKDEVYGKGFGNFIDGYVQVETAKEFYTREGSLDGINLWLNSNSGERNEEFSVMSKEQIYEAATRTYRDLMDKYDFIALFDGTDEYGASIEYVRLRNQQISANNWVAAQVLDSMNDNRIYHSYFSHWTPGRENEIRWSWHSSCLWYSFSSLRDIPEQRDWTRLDYYVADGYSSYLANFIASGDPNGDWMPYWPNSTMGNAVFMELGDEFVLRSDFYGDSKRLSQRDDFMREYAINANGFQDLFN